MKAVMKYPGSKWSLEGWITSFSPEHHSYLEPFFGSGAVLSSKPRSHIETVNDLDGNVVKQVESEMRAACTVKELAPVSNYLTENEIYMLQDLMMRCKERAGKNG